MSKFLLMSNNRALTGNIIFISFAIVFIGLLEVKTKSFKHRAAFLSILNTFAAGTFLAMALSHILPESVALYESAMESSETTEEDGHDHDHAHDHEEETTEEHAHSHLFPLPYLLFMTGYAIVLFIDKVAMRTCGNHPGHHGEGHKGQL